MSNYLTSTELLNTLGVTSGAQQELDADAACSAASRAIDNLCQRRFYADSNSTQVRYYGPAPNGMRLQIEDLITLTSLVTRDDGGNVDTNDGGLQTWTLNTDFVVGPLNAAQNSADVWPWTRLEVMPTGSYTFNMLYPRSVKLTGKFGWSAVPGPILDAATLLAERVYKMKREAPLGTIAVADMAIRIARADSNIMILVGPYMKYRPAVS